MRQAPTGKRGAGEAGTEGSDAALPGVAGDGAPLAAGYAWRIALLFTALFLVAGTKLPYLPLWLDWRGLTASEIAVVTAVPLFLRILAGPLIAMAADRWGDRRQAVILLGALSLGSVAMLGLAEGFWPILAITMVTALAAMGQMPLAETLAMSGVRRGGLDYGRMRLWGSLSFIVAGFVAGYAITREGPGAVLWLLIAAGALTLAVSLLLPADPDADAAAAKRPTLAAMAGATLSPRFLVFLVAAGACQSSHAVFYTFGVLDWQRQGLSTTASAACWSVGVVAEIILFAFSGRAVAAVGAAGLIALGAIAGLVRWTAMAFDPPFALLVALQALHGATFGAAHLGALHFISAEVAPSESGTAQAVYASVTSGIGLGLATLAAGPLYASFGGGAYLAMSLLSLAGLAAAMALGRPVRR